MKLARVVLRESGYDPRTEREGQLNGCSEFNAGDGYEIVADGGWLRVSHSGRTAVFCAGLMRHGVEAVEVVARPASVTPAEQPTQGAQQKQWKGKR